MSPSTHVSTHTSLQNTSLCLTHSFQKLWMKGSPAVLKCGYCLLGMRPWVLCCSRQSRVRVLMHCIQKRIAVICWVRSPIGSGAIHVLRIVISTLWRWKETWWVTRGKWMRVRIWSVECTVHGCPGIICLILICRVTVASITHSWWWWWWWWWWRWWGWCIATSTGTSWISPKHHWLIRSLWYYTALRCTWRTSSKIRRGGTGVVLKWWCCR